MLVSEASRQSILNFHIGLLLENAMGGKCPQNIVLGDPFNDYFFRFWTFWRGIRSTICTPAPWGEKYVLHPPLAFAGPIIDDCRTPVCCPRFPILRIRKILVSVKFVSAILGPEMAARILWAPGKNAVFLQENLRP